MRRFCSCLCSGGLQASHLRFSSLRCIASVPSSRTQAAPFADGGEGPAFSPGLRGVRSAANVSNGAAARRAEARSRDIQRSTAAAIMCRTRNLTWAGDHQNLRRRVRRACPNHGDDPADHRPAKKKINQEDAQHVAMPVPDDRGHEVQQRQKKQKSHVRTIFSIEARRTSVKAGLQPCRTQRSPLLYENTCARANLFRVR